MKTRILIVLWIGILCFSCNQEEPIDSTLKASARIMPDQKPDSSKYKHKHFTPYELYRLNVLYMADMTCDVKTEEQKQALFNEKMAIHTKGPTLICFNSLCDQAKQIDYSSEITAQEVNNIEINYDDWKPISQR